MGAFPSENFFKIMQFSPKSNFISGFFIPLQGKNHAIFPKIIGRGSLPLAVKTRAVSDGLCSPTLLCHKYFFISTGRTCKKAIAFESFL
jgi:hypothetical protein